MNYIQHLQAFYHHVKRDGRLSSTHICLYMALFQYWNHHRFQNNFILNREQLMKLSKIGSKNTYHKAIKELSSFGYIIHYPGNNIGKHARVTIARLGTKQEGDDRSQLNLFAKDKEGSNKRNVTNNFDGENTFMLEEDSTASGTHQGTDYSNDSTSFDTAIVPILTGDSTTFDTIPVPVLVPYIKQVNSKQVCKHNTHTQAKKKNLVSENTIGQAVKPAIKNEQQALAFHRAAYPAPAPTNNKAPAAENIPAAISEVEAYFKKTMPPATKHSNSFTTTRAAAGCSPKQCR